jgi:hypothetical protein
MGWNSSLHQPDRHVTSLDSRESRFPAASKKCAARVFLILNTGDHAPPSAESLVYPRNRLANLKQAGQEGRKTKQPGPCQDGAGLHEVQHSDKPDGITEAIA